MMNLPTNVTTGNSLGKEWAGSFLLALACTWFVMLGAVAANAQNPEVGGARFYQPEKTVADYNKNAQQPDAGDFDYADNSLRVEVWVDKPQAEIYRKGENISVGVQTNQDAYAVIYRIDTEGVVTVLWPRSRFDDGFIFGGHEYELPVSGARQLHVSALPGEGVVEAIASRYPFDLRALELDFHHERATEQYNFQVAGDPFLAMNEVNFAITGLEDSAEYVVTNYASYYVHQAVDHPRYLCTQCHLADEVAYDPYQDTCTLDIEYDYSWYNSWYDTYGYYPVYGNPVYVYVDPWTLNPWVNYWYQPYYISAPWYGWGWGWGSCYGWNYSPYYYGDSMTAYNSGYTRYRPLDRSGGSGTGGPTTKTREYTRGSDMVRKTGPSDRDRSAMTARTGRSGTSKTPLTVAGRSGGRDVAYRGAPAETRSRTSFDQVATRGRGQSGLRIRETGRAQTSGRGGSNTTVARKRHTAGGAGQRAGLAPVNRGSSFDNTNWRGTTRVGGTDHSVRSTGRTSGSSNRGSSATSNSRSRNSSGGKAVQPRKRSTRVWTAPTGRAGTSSRTRSGAVNTRSGRSTGHSKGTSVKGSRPVKQKSSGSTVRTRGGSKGSTSSRSSGGSRSSGASRSGSSSRGSSRSSGGGRSGTSRR